MKPLIQLKYKKSFITGAINYRANIWAFKEEGCTHLVATNACGSLDESIRPGSLVLVDGFIGTTPKLFLPDLFTFSSRSNYKQEANILRRGMRTSTRNMPHAYGAGISSKTRESMLF